MSLQPGPVNWILGVEHGVAQLAKKSPPAVGHIYVVGAIDGPKKIGIAANPRARLSTLQISSPERLVPNFFAACGYSQARLIEAKAHKLLQENRRSGEWFAISADAAIAAVVAAAAELGYQLAPLSVTVTPRSRRQKTMPDPGEPPKKRGRKPKHRLAPAKIAIDLNGRFEAARDAAGHTHTEAIEEAIRLYVEARELGRQA